MKPDDNALREAEIRPGLTIGSWLKATTLVGEVLTLLGADTRDPNFQGTPARFVEYLELHLQSPADIDNLTHAVFPSTYKGIVVETGIGADGCCPHHLLPVSYSVSVGYLANERVFGLSKLVRLVRNYAERAWLQESVTEAIASKMESMLSAEGVGVVVHGYHSCMSTRGVKSSPRVTTSSLTGSFREPGLRAEFLALVSTR